MFKIQSVVTTCQITAVDRVATYVHSESERPDLYTSCGFELQKEWPARVASKSVKIMSPLQLIDFTD